MAGFNLYISNRIEVLAQQLADVLRDPLSDPLRSEIVIVQTDCAMPYGIRNNSRRGSGISIHLDN
jgi:exonuclease V gamma subunit